MMKKLHLIGHNRTLTIKGFELNKIPYVTLNCYEYWESDDPDFGEGEQDNATFYLSIDNTDKLIEKLNEAKKYLQNSCI